MKKIVAFSLTLLFMWVVSSCNTPEVPELYNQGINVTPMPMELTQKKGSFKLSDKVVFVSADENSDKIAAYFAAKIKNSTGFNLQTVKKKPASKFIQLNLVSDAPVNEEGYLLEVTTSGIDIQANTPQGLFYGMQTVLQLLPAEIQSPVLVEGVAWTLPAVSIKDEPRFKYRGMHLDVCRHFASVDFLKKQLDVLAMFKINKFHWHLTEDQGWRIEIKKYPELTTVGAQRVEGEGNTYGPFFYTQEQVKEIVAYAKERFIEVIPEVELPGHAVAAINAYPELACTGKKIPVRNIWGIANDVFCAGNEQVFSFLEDVITEVIPLFESDYFHIGGDECPKIRWKECPKCQARIKSLGLKGDKEHSAEEKLQSYFVQRIEKFLLKHNKKMIGWDEILEGGLAPTATVMSWRGEEGGIASANMGHDVIMTPGGWLYLDKYQGDSRLSSVTIGGLLTLEKVYMYDPVPQKIAEDKKHHILGAQGNMWNEYNYTEKEMEYDIYPRIIALAELTWTPEDKKDYKDFERRIENQRVRLDMYDVNYYIPMPEQAGEAPSCNFVAFTDQTTVGLKSTEPVKMVYTLDGTEPTLNSTEYTEPLTFTENTVLNIRSVVLSGKMGPTRTITFEKQTYAPASEKPENRDVKTEYYKGLCRTAAELKGKKADRKLDAPIIYSRYRVKGYSEVYEDDLWSSRHTGYIHIKEDGVYYFHTDGEFWLNDQLLISNEKDNQGTARRFSRSDKSIALAKGYHRFELLQLGAIFGGWPTQWDNAMVSIRKEGEPKFRPLDVTDLQ
ncbi:family 20 glycosylhydrolase [Bacteroides sp. 224]|uniref:family 20 glycosylhydrolase n=1 Tax=Bacteroides sp. 224 TaxID=2302936 RepID=UPI0013D8A613|nr:family 20 glycosylhydrolase [Bacteroides sp. 224]NDV64753.1 beta-hexosaminidase [Bacteroides sp. 224]